MRKSQVGIEREDAKSSNDPLKLKYEDYLRNQRGLSERTILCRSRALWNCFKNGVDRTVIALWLGHESVETTQVYMHAEMRLKEKALARVASTTSRPGRYKPDDALLAFLESL